MQAPTGSTENADEGINHPCLGEEEKVVAEAGVKMLECDGDYQAGRSSSSKNEDMKPALEALIHRIVKEGKKPAGEREASKMDVDNQPRYPFMPRGKSLE